ncbi:hypothetical protein PENTCL1PPCAC_16158, partial [Pristionchus entomophagus]
RRSASLSLFMSNLNIVRLLLRRCIFMAEVPTLNSSVNIAFCSSCSNCFMSLEISVKAASESTMLRFSGFSLQK